VSPVEDQNGTATCRVPGLRATFRAVNRLRPRPPDPEPADPTRPPDVGRPADSGRPTDRDGPAGPGRPGDAGPPVDPQEARATQILSATLDGLRESLDTDMPAGALREYWLWGLDPRSPVHGEFVQVIGARKLCQLTATMLDGLVEDADWRELTRFVVAMNVYQLYEIVSDNLAIGAEQPHRQPPAPASGVLRFFNLAMVAALQGAPARATQLLAPVERAAGRLSAFTHSLAGPAHQRMASTFSLGRSRAAVREVEYGLWPALVANMVAATRMLELAAQLAVQPILRTGLVNRYQAVNRTLIAAHLPLFELATVGAHAILVAPTLIFYIGALGELIRPDPGLPGCVVDGTLPEVLSDAALLVRMLNDIGPGLLTCAPVLRRDLVGRLGDAYAGAPGRYPDWRALLLSDVEPTTVLTRLRKDVQVGEFNIALYGARHAHSVPDALHALGHALDYFAMLYAIHSEQLDRALDRLQSRLRDPRPLALVARFVRFHQDLYAHPYTDQSGEYAV
jgi:hypothetical protein